MAGIPSRVPVTAGSKAPKPPAVGGHYVKVGNQYQLIHAVGHGKWARGPVPMVGGMSVNNPLLQPGQSLSGKSLGQAAQALTDTQTKGPLSDLARQIAESNRQTQGTMNLAGGYYKQLGGQAQQGVTDEQGIANDLNAALQRIAGGTNQQLQGIGQNAQDSLLAHAPQGEGGLAASALGSIASETARQQGLAAQQQGNQQAFGANQGANYSGLAATGLSSNALAGTQALRGIAQSGTVKNEPLLAKVADLQAQRGALLSTNLGRLRQQEVNNRVTEQGLGIKDQSLRQAAAQDAASNALAARGQDVTARGQSLAYRRSQDTIAATNRRDQLDRQSRESIAKANRIAAANRAAARKGGSGSRGRGGALTTHENNTILGSLDKIQNAIGIWQHAGMHIAADGTVIDGKTYKKGEVAPHPSNAAMRQTLGGSYPSYLVQAAFELLGWGHVTPGTASALHQHGIRGGTFRGRPIRVAPPPTGAQQVGSKVGGAVKGIANAVGGVFGQ